MPGNGGACRIWLALGVQQWQPLLTAAYPVRGVVDGEDWFTIVEKAVKRLRNASWPVEEAGAVRENLRMANLNPEVIALVILQLEAMDPTDSTDNGIMFN